MAVYKERIYLTPWIRWGAVALISAIMIFGILSGTIWESNDDDQWFGLLISLIGGILGIAIAIVIHLDLRLSKDTIEYRMFPLEFKTKILKVAEVESIEVRKFGAFPTYGGFGKRRKPWKKEIAYIMNRKFGLFVELKNGKKRIFSTNGEKKLKQYIRNNYTAMLNVKKDEEV